AATARPVPAPTAAEAQKGKGGNSRLHADQGYPVRRRPGETPTRINPLFAGFFYASASRSTAGSGSPSVFRSTNPPRTKSSTSTTVIATRFSSVALRAAPGDTIASIRPYIE